MRVGIDATYLLEPRKTGVETYTLNLVRALLALPERPELALYAAGPTPDPDTQALFQAADRAHLSRVHRLWLRLRLPLRLLGDRVEVAHFPGTLLPYWLPCPVVTTFYDLAAYRYPELYDPAELGLYRHLIPAAARRSTAILAVSECTRRDLVELLHVPAEKVFVTPLGVDARFRPVPGAAEVVAERFSLKQPYILACVGSGHPRKNLRGTVEAFAALGRADLSLAIIGTAKRDPGALAAIETSPARHRIRLLGYVAEDDLPLLYSAATVFCFPSFYEGFGLPVLEAMACGTPVICGDTSSLAEVAGDAALLVAPQDSRALAEALAAVVEDSGLRAGLSAVGFERVQEFTWERTARATIEAYWAAAKQSVARRDISTHP